MSVKLASPVRAGEVFLFLFLLTLLAACANYRPHYSQRAADWRQQRPEPELPLAHSVYLLGGVGLADSVAHAPALQLLRRKILREGPSSTVLFLGDNVFPDGLPPPTEEEARRLAESQLRAQTEALRGFSGQVYFTPGHRDWRRYGVDGLRRQRELLSEQLQELGFIQRDYLLPDPGCAGPEEVELNDNLVLLFVDSQWWLQDWEGEEEVNADCRVKSREALRIFFEEEIKGNRSRNVIVVMHHPPYSTGPHGGQFTVRQHLFPFTDLRPNLWVPLPVVGSVYPFLRASMGTRQDVIHPEYAELRRILLASARRNGSFIFVAGHEQSLQYLERDEQHIVVSGSGGGRSATRISSQAQFAYGAEGISRLDMYADGSVWVTFWAVDPEDPEGQVVFRKKVSGAIAPLAGTGPTEFPFYAEGRDSVTLPLGEYDYSRGPVGRFLWGEHYRQVYDTEVEMPVLDLAQYRGGVVPVKRGGGYQTRSLRLQDDRGRQYNLRSVDKDPRLLAPHPLHDSKIVLDIIKDSYSGAHPLAATPLPAMQDQLGLYHTNPELYYAPSQPGLANFNDGFGDALYLLEERPDEDVWQDQASFGRPDDLVSTRKMLEEVQDDHDHRVDHAWVLRARLFDNVIGDWDRHDDQWRWSVFDQGDSVLYRPVPRDRDHAFGEYDGLLIALVRETLPAVRPLRPFFKHMKRVWWANYGGRYFDRTLLSPMAWSDWEREVRYIQDRLDDASIERAVREAWPDPVYALDGPHIVETVQARRDTLMDLARRYYRKLAREVDVVGTHQRDLFLVERLNDEETRVRVYDTNRAMERQQLLYDRTFRRDETRELRLYGLQDDDFFQLEGQVRRGIRVRIIGGLGSDTFIDRSRVDGPSHKTIIHDASTEINAIQLGREARERFSADPKYNTYNRLSTDHSYPWWLFLPDFGINPDDGLLLGASAMHTTYGFKKQPHASQQRVAVRFATATAGVDAAYRGEFIDIWNDWELLVEARYRSPLYATNFYGFGNATENTEEVNGNDYHRVRRREIALAPALMRILNPAARVSFGPTYEAFRVERTSGRFIDDYADREGAYFGPEFFEGQIFGGLRAVFDFDNVDNPIYPSQGMHFRVDAGYKNHLNSGRESFGFLDGQVAGYQALDNDLRFVVASRLGFSHRFGDGYAFYQAARLGGTGPEANLRGFRRDRFSGKTAFFHNTDLRWKFLHSYNNLLPFCLGAYAGFDYGRVWLPGESSRAWHFGYGGGLFLQPLELISLQANAFRGDGGTWRFVVMADFLF